MRAMAFLPFLFLLTLCAFSGAQAVTQFRSSNLTYANGTEFFNPTLVSLAFSQSDPSLLLVSTFLGKIILLHVDQRGPFDYIITRHVDELNLGFNVVHLHSDPFSNAFFVVMGEYFWWDKGLGVNGWTDGRVGVLRIVGKERRLVFDTTPLISGLPLANDSFAGPYSCAVNSRTGMLYVPIASFASAGVVSGGTKEHIWSSAMMLFDIRKRRGMSNKRIAVKWSSTDISQARPFLNTIKQARVLASGLRSVFQPVVTPWNSLVITDAGGSPEMGKGKSASCSTEVPAIDESDRFIHVRWNRWYGAANRLRATLRRAKDRCRFIWGDEPNIDELAKQYKTYTRPLFTTRKQKDDNVLGSGTDGFTQYLANWVPSLRGKFFGIEFDIAEVQPAAPVAQPREGSPKPGMYAVDVRKKKYLGRIADSPGTNGLSSAYGAVFTTQFNLGKISFAYPPITEKMKTQRCIRAVFPTRARAGTTITVITTGVRESKGTIKIGGKATQCTWSTEMRFGFVKEIRCVVPTFRQYNGRAVSIVIASGRRVGLVSGVVVLSPHIQLVD